MNQKLFYNAMEVADMLDVSRAKAYQIIKALNVELEERGYIVIQGKVPKKFFAEKYYGLAQ